MAFEQRLFANLIKQLLLVSGMLLKHTPLSEEQKSPHISLVLPGLVHSAWFTIPHQECGSLMNS